MNDLKQYKKELKQDFRKLSEKELKTVWSAVQAEFYRRAVEKELNFDAMALNFGDKVKFDNDGDEMNGTVKSVGSNGITLRAFNPASRRYEQYHVDVHELDRIYPR
tara:strand:- start:366 stop:683 length:318 start_codon:yes stop_codon:yes gene_type:complete